MHPTLANLLAVDTSDPLVIVLIVLAIIALLIIILRGRV